MNEFQLLIVCFALCDATVRATVTCPNAAATNTLKDTDRDLLLQYHNDARRAVAQGIVNTSLGMIGPAQNMYEMQYDCNLDTAADTANTKTCVGVVNGAMNGDNVQYWSTASIYKLDAEKWIQQSVADWFLPAVYYGYDGGSAYTDPRLEFFSNLVNYKNLKFGCAVTDCPKAAPIEDRKLLRCLYSTPQFEREALIRFRSQTALGNTPNGVSGVNLPTATNMLKMVYDCDLERDAIIYAQTCSGTGSANGTRPGQDENVYLDANAFDQTTAVQNAVIAWFSPIRNTGINNNVQYHSTLANKATAPKTAIRIMWAKTWKLGCAAIDCSLTTGGGMFTVCRYAPPGFQLNHYIYDKGTPCSKCPSSFTTCSMSEGLCGI
ncbi:unnamed protein product [Nippostrongylus brasiliensis]|uniref:SCP domain-containing protein n=1 Tax=Nippostrongylus brasiliensis TaxID=27835 RepID=A0A0N4YAW7_NIPBR|nr:unnamed protein product [Nippostrongylus brasiliensis]